MREFIKIDEDKNRIEFLDSRFYYDEVTGEFLPSVTTILESYPKTAQFYEWLKQMGDKADEVRDEAGRKGSNVHQMTEDYDNGQIVEILDGFGKPKVTQIEWSMFERYVEFRNTFEFRMIANEVHYISPELGFAGTLDRVFEWEGENWLVDIKTSNAIHEHYWLQQAAYARLWEKFNKTKIDKIGVLWLNAKTRTAGRKGDIQGVGWKLYECPESRKDLDAIFEATKLLWLRTNATTKPRNKVYNLKHLKDIK